MSLPNYLAKIKSSGIYRFVWDKSVVPPQTAETLRLVVGYSEKGPFNTPVYVDNVADFITIFGNTSKKLERKGIFFHRMALQALSAGPILALNLKPFDAETIDYVDFNPVDMLKEFSIKNAAIKDVYDTNRFWYLDAEQLAENVGANNYMTIAHTDVDNHSCSIIMRPSDVSGYDLTIREWYASNGEEIPTYLEPIQNELLSKYFIDVYVFRGEFTHDIVKEGGPFGGYITEYNEDGSVIGQKWNGYFESQGNDSNVVNITCRANVDDKELKFEQKFLRAAAKDTTFADGSTAYAFKSEYSETFIYTKTIKAVTEFCLKPSNPTWFQTDSYYMEQSIFKVGSDVFVKLLDNAVTPLNNLINANGRYLKSLYLYMNTTTGEVVCGDGWYPSFYIKYDTYLSKSNITKDDWNYVPGRYHLLPNIHYNTYESQAIIKNAEGLGHYWICDYEDNGNPRYAYQVTKNTAPEFGQFIPSNAVGNQYKSVLNGIYQETSYTQLANNDLIIQIAEKGCGQVIVNFENPNDADVLPYSYEFVVRKYSSKDQKYVETVYAISETEKSGSVVVVRGDEDKCYISLKSTFTNGDPEMAGWAPETSGQSITLRKKDEADGTIGNVLSVSIKYGSNGEVKEYNINRRDSLSTTKFVYIPQDIMPLRKDDKINLKAVFKSPIPIEETCSISFGLTDDKIANIKVDGVYKQYGTTYMTKTTIKEGDKTVEAYAIDVNLRIVEDETKIKSLAAQGPLQFTLVFQTGQNVLEGGISWHSLSLINHCRSGYEEFTDFKGNAHKAHPTTFTIDGKKCVKYIYSSANYYDQRSVKLLNYMDTIWFEVDDLYRPTGLGTYFDNGKGEFIDITKDHNRILQAITVEDNTYVKFYTPGTAVKNSVSILGTPLDKVYDMVNIKDSSDKIYVADLYGSTVEYTSKTNDLVKTDWVVGSERMIEYIDEVVSDFKPKDFWINPDYVNVYGEEIDAIEALANDSSSNFIRSYQGCLLPFFKDGLGNYISIDLLFNADNNLHKMLMKLDESKLYDVEDIDSILYCRDKYNGIDYRTLYKNNPELASHISPYQVLGKQEADVKLKPLYLKGYKYNAIGSKDSGMILQNKILKVLEDKGIRTALTNNVDVNYHYIVDTFQSYIENGCKSKLAQIAKEKDNAFAILNFPPMPEFVKNSNFKSSITGKFDMNEIANKSNGFSLVSENNGASWCAYYTGVTFSDGTLKQNVPSAAIVSNNFMEKWGARQPYYIVAGPNYGRIAYDGLVGPDYNYGRSDLDVLEPLGVNAIIYVPRKGTYINSNQTAKQTPVTALSKVHVRELVIYLQNEIESLLQNYQWELNTQTLRDTIKAKADSILENVKNNGGVYAYANVCDGTNNTAEIIDNEMIVLDTSIEPARGAGKMVQQLTIHRTGGITSTTK